MPHRSFRARRYCLFWALCAGALLTACHRGEDLPGAATEPAAAVRQWAKYLHDDDWVGYARVTVPPAQYAQLEAAWAQGRSRWPLTELPLHDKLPELLARLSADDAQTRLQQAFDAEFAGNAADVGQTAQLLGLWGAGYLKERQNDYSDAERAHYLQLVDALSAWGQAAPLADPALARSGIATLTTAARATGLGDDASFQAAGMTGSLRRLGPFARACKRALAGYGLSLDDSLAGLRAGLVQQQGDQATVRVQYPLAGRQIDAQVALQRREGRWYPARTLAEVDALLAAAQAPGVAAPAGDAGDGAKP